MNNHVLQYLHCKSKDRSILTALGRETEPPSPPFHTGDAFHSANLLIWLVIISIWFFSQLNMNLVSKQKTLQSPQLITLLNSNNQTFNNFSSPVHKDCLVFIFSGLLFLQTFKDYTLTSAWVLFSLCLLLISLRTLSGPLWFLAHYAFKMNFSFT